MDDILTLRRHGAAVVDQYGIKQPGALEEITVFCNVMNISQTEFFEAGRNGLNPQFKFLVFHGDYNGETFVEYQGKQYAVYRTYRTQDDYIELYVQREGGTNG